MASLKPLKIYAHGPSPNPWKVIIILKELGLPYEIEHLGPAALKEEPYLSINPNGRAPAVVDPNRDITLWESGAIIDYLIDVYDTKGLLHYTSFPEKYTTRIWEHFQMSGQGPYFGQKGWFEMFHQEKLPSAIERYRNEIKRVIGVIDAHLTKQGTEYLVGDRVTYADLMFILYFTNMLAVMAPEVDTSEWKQYTAWLGRLCARPAVAETLTEVRELAEQMRKQRGE